MKFKCVYIYIQLDKQPKTIDKYFRYLYTFHATFVSFWVVSSAKASSRAPVGPGLATVIEKLQKEIDDKAAGSPPEPWPWAQGAVKKKVGQNGRLGE